MLKHIFFSFHFQDKFERGEEWAPNKIYLANISDYSNFFSFHFILCCREPIT